MFKCPVVLQKSKQTLIKNDLVEKLEVLILNNVVNNNGTLLNFCHFSRYDLTL